MRSYVVVGSTFCLLGVAASVAAQDRGRVGITMGYPASVGLLWHVSETTALRPEFTFNRDDASSESLVSARSNFWSTAAGASVLFYSSVRDNLRTYVAPRFSYARTRGTSDITSSTTNSYAFAGMFGAQYSLGKRFAAFGEVGFGYSRQTGSVTSPVFTTKSRSNSVGTRSGAGVILYFGD